MLGFLFLGEAMQLTEEQIKRIDVAEATQTLYVELTKYLDIDWLRIETEGKTTCSVIIEGGTVIEVNVDGFHIIWKNGEHLHTIPSIFVDDAKLVAYVVKLVQG